MSAGVSELSVANVGPLHLAEFYADDPWSTYAWLRREAPVFRHEFDGGAFWVLSKHDDVSAAARNPRVFSSAQGFLMPGGERDQLNQLVAPSIMAMDPPQHTALRKLVQHHFAPRAVYAMEQEIRDYLHEVLDELNPGQPFDLVETIAARLPIYVIGVLMGIPADERGRFLDIVDASVAYSDPATISDAQGAVAMATAFSYFDELLNERRMGSAGDVVSELAHAEIDGEPVDQLTAVKSAFLILVGGSETTRHLMSCGTLALIEHPDQQRLLRADRSLMPKAVEEMLRFISPVRYFARTTTADTTVRGKSISAGDSVMMLFESANRDEEVFGLDAEEFRINREPRQHMSFGFGEHFCLGARLARLEAQIYFDELLDRYPNWALAGEIERVHEPEISGLKRLPITFS
ncbi:MAG: cytochrome P450 [Mycobacterium sp.]|uniref:cytochrome P450 n=1 Tax=Mycobacterium sp. TaxID=1785 RepID=UPI003C4C59B4